MNGKKARALKRAFRDLTGRDPHTGVRRMRDEKEVVGGRWRNAYHFHDRLYGLESMIVIEPSEWRRVKRAAQ